MVTTVSDLARAAPTLIELTERGLAVVMDAVYNHLGPVVHQTDTFYEETIRTQFSMLGLSLP